MFAPFYKQYNIAKHMIYFSRIFLWILTIVWILCIIVISGGRNLIDLNCLFLLLSYTYNQNFSVCGYNETKIIFILHLHGLDKNKSE